MLFPRGTPVYENIATARLNPAAVLTRLRESKLTGYARFSFAAKSTLCLFNSGRLINVLLEGEHRLHSLDALIHSFETLATEGGTLDVYKLSDNLTGSLQALLEGKALYQGQDLRLINAKAFLSKLRAQGLTGCVRIYTPEVTSLIFYKEGNAVGFFHDGAPEIETSAAESQRIASLPGAKLDVFTIQNGEALVAYDIFEFVDVDKIWAFTSQRHAQELAERAKQSAKRAMQQREEALAALTGNIKTIAENYLGRVGSDVIGKALEVNGGSNALLENDSLSKLLRDIESTTKLLTSQTKATDMLHVIRKEIAERLPKGGASGFENLS